MIKHNNLACSIWSSTGKHWPMVIEGLKLVSEWVESSVQHYGDSEEKR